MPRTTIIVLTERSAATVAALLGTAEFRIVVPAARDDILPVIQTEHPVALVVTNDLSAAERHALLEILVSRAPQLPIIHLQAADESAESAASFALCVNCGDELRMALIDLSALL